MTSALSASKYI